MRIGLLADIHYGYGDTAAVTTELRGVIERFNDDIHPDVTVVLGDLIHESDSARGDRDRLDRLTELLAGLDSPVVYLLGNHDVMNLDRDTIHAVLDQDRWGRVDGTDLLYLDSSAPHLSGSRGELDADQLAFLRRELASVDAGLVFVHHPIHYHDISDNYWFGDYPERGFCGNKKELNRIIADHGGVVATFNGHLHETAYTTAGGLHHFTINAFNRERPDAGVTGTYAAVQFDDELRVRVVEGERIERSIAVPV